MVDVSSSNFTNFTTKLTKIGKEGETQNDIYEVNCIITIIINCITCPLTILLNVLVIMAVKRRPRLQSNMNILLACLAATDVFTGLTAQPSFILGKIFELRDMTGPETFLSGLHKFSVRVISVCSCLHLTLVTCERLVAIKFTLRYPYLVTKRNIKVAVIKFWAISLFYEVFKSFASAATLTFSRLMLSFTFISCILFILYSYLILYLETLRHQKKIRTQQLPQEEVERFSKESKALKTTVFVVGAVVICFVPVAFTLKLSALGLDQGPVSIFVFTPWIRTFVMLNSLLNPLIYCWRQKEMRKFIFRFRTQAVHPAN